MDTASMALAPRRTLFSVPSRSIRSCPGRPARTASRPSTASEISVLMCFHRLEHAPAQVAGLVAVARSSMAFAAAGGGARRHGGAAHGAGFQQHVAFDGGIAAAVEDLAADDVNDWHSWVWLSTGPFTRRLKNQRKRAVDDADGNGPGFQAAGWVPASSTSLNRRGQISAHPAVEVFVPRIGQGS